MRNIKLIIEYDGTDYAGWQLQRKRPETKTLQETLEKTLQKILQERVGLVASGRTDAGVHAQAQTVNFKTRSEIPLPKLERALNGLLPKDIAVISAREAALDFHSRFKAKSKLYRYTILNRPQRSAFLRNTVYFYPYPLDVRLMQREAKVLLGRHDFSAFKASDKKERGSIRTIKRLKVWRDQDLIHIDVEADGFLYNMVRNIAGTLIDIGRQRLKSGQLKRILSARDRRLAGPTAPANGLSLIKVNY